MPPCYPATLAILLVIHLLCPPTPTAAELAMQSCNISRADRLELSAQVVAMFDHAYKSYLTYAHPGDELLPLSCAASNSFGGLSVTLIDTLDTFVVLRQWPRFARAVQHVSAHTNFAVDRTVSVFETTIRVMGGLLSAHGLLTEGIADTGFDPQLWAPWYDGALLRLAKDLGDRLMPAFDTPTAIPFGSINLIHGVNQTESRIASTAGAGSLVLEFGTLSRLVGDPTYYRAAFAAMHALHSRAAERTGLVGNHIDIFSGEWVAPEAGVGGLVDSFYEYMYKGYILFGDERLLNMFQSSYKAIRKYLHKQPWYLDAHMWTGTPSSTAHSSLAAFWPGLQVLFGDVNDAIETTRAHYSVWRRYGCLPEGYDVVEEVPYSGQVNYPLRPELVESVFYLHWATNDSSWVGVARAMMFSLEQLTRVRCGFAAIKDVRAHETEDLMPSFLMSETFKYMYLVFASEGADGQAHWARSGKYVFTTEAHPLRIATGGLHEVLGSETGQAMEASGRGTRRKCARRGDAMHRLPCGYGMGGTDFPQVSGLGMRSNSEASVFLSKSVSKAVRQRLQAGVPVVAGEVMMGNGWAVRIVGVHGTMVSFEAVDEAEAGAGAMAAMTEMEEEMATEAEAEAEAEAERLRRARAAKVCRRESAEDVVVGRRRGSGGRQVCRPVGLW